MSLMDNIPGWKVFSAGIGLAALAAVGYFVYIWFIATPQDLKPLQEEALAHALDQLSERYAEKVRTQGEQNVVVMPVEGDTTNKQVRARLITRLNRVEGIKADLPRDPTLEQRAGALVRGMISGDKENAPDPQAVFEDSGESDEVISVKVHQNWSGADSGIFSIDVYRIIRDETPERKARVLEPERIKGLSGTARPGDEPGEASGDFWSGFGRFMLGLIIVLAVAGALPLLAWPLAKAVFRLDSNLANIGLLSGLTLLDLTALFVYSALATDAAFNTTAVISGAILLPLAAFFNLAMPNFIEER